MRLQQAVGLVVHASNDCEIVLRHQMQRMTANVALLNMALRKRKLGNEIWGRICHREIQALQVGRTSAAMGLGQRSLQYTDLQKSAENFRSLRMNLYNLTSATSLNFVHLCATELCWFSLPLPDNRIS